MSDYSPEEKAIIHKFINEQFLPIVSDSEHSIANASVMIVGLCEDKNGGLGIAKFMYHGDAENAELERQRKLVQKMEDDGMDDDEKFEILRGLLNELAIPTVAMQDAGNGISEVVNESMTKVVVSRALAAVEGDESGERLLEMFTQAAQAS